MKQSFLQLSISAQAAQDAFKTLNKIIKIRKSSKPSFRRGWKRTKRNAIFKLHYNWKDVQLWKKSNAKTANLTLVQNVKILIVKIVGFPLLADNPVIILVVNKIVGMIANRNYNKKQLPCISR